MAKVHLSHVRKFGSDCRRTGTLCNRMSNAGEDINCSTDLAAVTCKICLREIEATRLDAELRRRMTRNPQPLSWRLRG